MEPEHRIPSLKASLKQLNTFLDTEVRGKVSSFENRELQCYRGLLIPFGLGEEPRLVLNILSDQVACFNTKKRCPIKIVFETIRLDDAARWNEVMSSVPASQIHEEEPSMIIQGLPSKRNLHHHEELAEEGEGGHHEGPGEQQDFEKLRHFARTIEKTEMRLSVGAARPQDDAVFRENPFS